MSDLSTLIITKNSGEVIEGCLKSLKRLETETIIVDGGSVDDTLQTARKYGCKIYDYKGNDFGKQKAYALQKATSDWVLSLDSDERVSGALVAEIQEILQSCSNMFSGYIIPFQNHFLGKLVARGGEDYKMLRLFRKDSVVIDSALVHEGFRMKSGKVGNMKSPILHFSYRSLWQMYSKFTDYAIREAEQKAQAGEKSSLKKIFMYPVHMVWARFIKDEGYKDGLFRLPLDIGFGYMEFLTYFLLAFKRVR